MKIIRSKGSCKTRLTLGNTIHVIILHKIIYKSLSFKIKKMKLPYTRKATFNINRTIIHVALAVPLNRGINKLKSFFDENRDGLIKIYNQLSLLIIDVNRFIISLWVVLT